MHFSSRSVILLLASSLARADAYSCFGADGTELKAAVEKYVAGTWETSPDAPNATTFGPIEDWCTKDVTTMWFLFGEAFREFNANITKWDVSSVKDMGYMFYKASQFNQNLSEWNVSSVANMDSMFRNAYEFNGDIAAWDVSSVTDMSSMFFSAHAFDQDISQWNVSKVEHMYGLFTWAYEFNQDISQWDVSSVTDMAYMFSGTLKFNQDISQWNVSKVTDMHGMFWADPPFPGQVEFYPDISQWDVSSVTDMRRMFFNATKFNQDISSWNTSSVIDMESMFEEATSFNQDISAWNTSSVRYMHRMFYNATEFNQDISAWTTSSVRNMNGMFQHATKFNQDLCAWKDKFPYNSAANIFSESGCTNKATPAVSDQDQVKGPFCAVKDCSDMTGPLSADFTLTIATNPTRRSRSLQTGIITDSFKSALNKYVESIVDDLFRGVGDGVTYDPSSLSIESYQEVDCSPNMPTGTRCYQVIVGVTLELEGQPPLTTRELFETGISESIEKGELSLSLPADSGIVVVYVATPAIESWDLNYASLTTNFDKGSVSEITLNYNIGKGRNHEVSVFKKGCKETITPDDVLTFSSSTSPNITDSSLDNLQVLLDLDKTKLSSSNIWNEATNNVVMCVKVGLLSGSNVIKTDERDVAINLDFGNTFTATADASLDQISLGNNNESTKVEDYIEACTCDDAASFECNTASLSPDSFLNVCIRSLSDEMEIDFLANLVMTSNDNEDNKFVIVQNANLLDSTISSKTKVFAKNGVHVASVIPARFFSYSATSSAKVTGVVYLKLEGSRRHLAVDVEIAGRPKVLTAGSTSIRALQLQTESVGDQKYAFAINVELEKNELGGDANGVTGAMMPGFIIVIVNLIGSAAVAMML